MSLGLIQPGAFAALRHPRTGELIKPIGYVRGKAVWPVIGGSGDDDPNDPAFTGEDDEDEDEDEDDDDAEDEDDKSKRRKKKSTKSKKDDDDEDDDEDEDDGKDASKLRAIRQAKRYRLELRAAQAELTKLQNANKKPEDVASEELTTAKSQVDKLTATNRDLVAQLAFFQTAVPGVQWVDPTDAFALADREGLFDDVLDDDGTVDTRELRRGLKDLAKRKPHLVVKAKSTGRADSDTDEDEDDDDEEDERPRRSARTTNTSRKGSRVNKTSRAALEKKFPVLRGR